MDIQSVSSELGHPPTPTEYGVEGQFEVLDIYTTWETWRDAIASTNYDPDELPSPRSDMDAVDIFDDLMDRIQHADTAREWSFLLKDHIRFGNTKLKSNIAIFNIGAASDCVNLGTEHCQVEAEACYARRDEKLFPHTLNFRRRQEHLWDCVDAETFAYAFLEMAERKRNSVESLRFNESGDLRHQADVERLNTIGKILEQHGITVYTYTASNFLDFPPADERHFVLNASNENVENADQQFDVVESEDMVPDDGYRCPYPKTETQCGDCLACLDKGGNGDVYEVLRGREHAD